MIWKRYFACVNVSIFISYSGQYKHNGVIIIGSILTVIGMAAIPLVELKGAIPVGMAMGMEPWTVFWLAYVGSTIVSPIIMLFFRPVVNWIHKRQIKPLQKLAHWAEERGYRKSAGVRKYSLLGLFIFVAIPLPGTGVWMGSLIATLLELRITHAFPVVAVGNLVAGLLIFLLSDFVIGSSALAMMFN